MVLVAYVVGVMLISLWVGRRQRSLASYLLGDRNLPWWAILGSVVATETSTASLLSVPGLAFASADGDFRFLQLSIGYIIGRALIVMFLLPLYFEGRLFTAYEVLERRFGGLTQRVASLIFLVCRNLGDGLRLFLTAIVLAEVLGWSLWICVITVGLVTAIYTFYGGIRAVVWNDCVQFVIYLLGAAAAIMVVMQRLPGGWDQCLEFARAHDKLRMFDFSFSWDQPLTFWAGLLGGMFLTLGTHGTDQMMVQRYLGARSQRGAGAAIALSGFVVMAQFTLFLFLGVTLASFYAAFPPTDPFAAGDYDKVVATFVVEEFPAGVGLIGLLLAAVFAAAMSTLSSSLNSSASAAVNDFYLKGRRASIDGGHALWATRWFTLLFAAIQIGVGIVAIFASDSVVMEALAIAGFAAGLLLGLFGLGLFAPKVGERSALLGLVAGAVVLLALRFGPLQLAWPWYPVVGSAVVFAVATLHTWAFRGGLARA